MDANGGRTGNLSDYSGDLGELENTIRLILFGKDEEKAQKESREGTDERIENGEKSAKLKRRRLQDGD